MTNIRAQNTIMTVADTWRKSTQPCYYLREWVDSLCGRLAAVVRQSIEVEENLSHMEELTSMFNSLITAHSALISRICFSYATDGEDYKDLRQDVMLNIWKGLSTFREESASITWIYRVAFNTCVSTVRKRSRQPFMEHLDSMPIDLPDLNEDEGIRERLEMLHGHISELSPIDKAIVTMWLDERSYEEIAGVIGMTRGNITLRMHRIKERWRKEAENIKKG